MSDRRGLRYARRAGLLIGELEQGARTKVIPGGILLVPAGCDPDEVASVAEDVRQRSDQGFVDQNLAAQRLAEYGLSYRPSELAFAASSA